MFRRLVAACATAVALLSGCSSSSSDSPPPVTETPIDPALVYSALQGAFSTCRNDGGGDYREILEFKGSAFLFRQDNHGTTNTSCGGDPEFDASGSGAGTFSIPGTQAVQDPTAAGTVLARKVDVSLPGGRALYTLGWIKAGTPDRMFGGDDSGTSDGSTPAKRPTALQSFGRDRLTLPVGRASSDGSWRVCRNDQPGVTHDYFEWMDLAGTTARWRTYATGTQDVTCGGQPVLASAGGLSVAFGADVPAHLGTVPITARIANLYDPAFPSSILNHNILAVDPYSSPWTLYLGDDSGNTDGSTPEKRPTALQSFGRALQPATNLGYPSALAGAWRDCVQNGGGDEAEVLTLDPSAPPTIAYTSVQYRYSSTNGTCIGGEVQTSTAAGQAFITGNGPATLPAPEGSAQVNTPQITVHQTSPSDVTFYTLIHVDPFVGGSTLYTGDETATPGLDGSTPAKRPTVLQTWRARFKQ